MWWWFSSHAASIIGRSKKDKTNLCDVECCRRFGANWLLNFRRPFSIRVWVESAPKIFVGEGCWLDEKKKKKKKRKKKKEKDLLNCKYKVTFQPDGFAEPTCAATCFIHFGFRPSSRQHPALEMYICGVLFVCLMFLFVSLECIRKSKGISVYNINKCLFPDKWKNLRKILITIIFCILEMTTFSCNKCRNFWNFLVRFSRFPISVLCVFCELRYRVFEGSKSKRRFTLNCQMIIWF